MRKVWSIVAGFALTACATAAHSSFIEYGFFDQPEQQRLELRYRNETKQTMCLAPEHWPNRAGKINQASDVVFLIVGSERFPIQDFNTGYCRGDECSLRVAPGEEVAAFIPYADFKLPERLWREAKTLEFRPQAYACRPS